MDSGFDRLAGLDVDPSTAHLTRAADGWPVYGITIDPAADPYPTWRMLRAGYGSSGLWPFVSTISPREWAERRTRPSVLTESERHGEILADLVRASADQLPQVRAEIRDAIGRLFDVDALVTRLGTGPLPAVAEPEARESVDPIDWICLVEVPEGGAGVPELLHGPHTPNWYGSAHHLHLTPADHSAVLQTWYERYGAELYYLDGNSLELTVARPPHDPAEVARVAVDQYAYCPDLDQILGDLDDVARLQVPGPRWYFWWD